VVHAANSANSAQHCACTLDEARKLICSCTCCFIWVDYKSGTGMLSKFNEFNENYCKSVTFNSICQLRCQKPRNASPKTVLGEFAACSTIITVQQDFVWSTLCV